MALAAPYARYTAKISCFANGRKHKPIGQLATSLLNKKNFETNLLEQALAKEICHLDQPQLFKDGVHLVDPISASKKSLQTLSNLIGEPIMSFTRQVSPWGLQKPNCISYCVMLPLPW